MGFLNAFARFLPTLGFATLAVIILVSGWMVARVRRITHAAFFMVLAFTGVAGVFIMLGADFLAAAQVLVYVGAIAVMFLFAIMVSDLKELSDSPRGREPLNAARGLEPSDTASGREPSDSASGPENATSAAGAGDGKPPVNRGRGPWVILAGLVAVGFAILVLAALGRSGVPAARIAAASGLPTTAPIGRALFTTFLIPFEVASIVLLVALVGAIVIAAREDDEPLVAKASELEPTVSNAPAGAAPGRGKGDAA